MDQRTRTRQHRWGRTVAGLLVLGLLASLAAGIMWVWSSWNDTRVTVINASGHPIHGAVVTVGGAAGTLSYPLGTLPAGAKATVSDRVLGGEGVAELTFLSQDGRRHGGEGPYLEPGYRVSFYVQPSGAVYHATKPLPWW